MAFDYVCENPNVSPGTSFCNIIYECAVHCYIYRNELLMFLLCLIKHDATRHIINYEDAEFHAFLNSEINGGPQQGTKH
jgi:hypothetical protein